MTGIENTRGGEEILAADVNEAERDGTETESNDFSVVIGTRLLVHGIRSLEVMGSCQGLILAVGITY